MMRRIFGFVFCLSIALLFCLWILGNAGRTPVRHSVEKTILPSAFGIQSPDAFHPRPQVALSSEQVRFAIDRLKLIDKSSLSILLHAGLVFGWSMPLPGLEASDKSHVLYEAIYDADVGREYFGRAPLRPSRYGLFNPVSPASESHLHPECQAHWGQLLSEIAKHRAELPQDSSLRFEAINSDLLADAIHQYSLKEPQNEWTCVAFARLIPPNKSWSNKFGEQFDFSGMARQLMSRRFDEAELSCYGLHVLEALATLYIIDRDQHILDTSTRGDVDDYLLQKIMRLEKSQKSDGSWGLMWNDVRAESPTAIDSTSRTDRIARVHISSHHVAWMLLLPPEMRPGDSIFQEAATFLLSELLAASAKELVSEYCPYSHAGHILQLLTERSHTSADHRSN